jgi:hypothetical protein
MVGRMKIWIPRMAVLAALQSDARLYSPARKDNHKFANPGRAGQFSDIRHAFFESDSPKGRRS